MLTAKVLVKADFRAALATMQAQLRNLDGVSKDILEVMGPVDKVQNVQTFATQGSASGDVWAKLSERYRKWKAKAKPGRTILQFSGDLRKASTDLSNKHRRVFMAAGIVNLGTNEPKASRHQLGGAFTEHVPAHVRKLKRSVKQRRDEVTGRFGRKAYTRSGFAYVKAHGRTSVLPARPFIRKNHAQVVLLRAAMMKGILTGLAKQTSGTLSRQLRVAAGRISVKGA